MGACGNGDDLGAFFEQTIEQAIPLSVHWDLTWRCDQKCVHCYLTDRVQPELGLESCVAVLDQLVEAGTLFLLFSGGDLFLRKDALEVLAAARDRLFDIKILTHGNHITEGVADALGAMGVARAGLSLYSEIAAEHDSITRIEGSHARTLAAARRLIDRGLRVELKTPVMVHNRRGWSGVGALAEAIGATWALDPYILPDDAGGFGLTGIALSQSERIQAVMSALEPRRSELVPAAALGETSPDRVVCSAGSAGAYIAPDGTLYPCINWREALGQLTETPFLELWRGPVANRQRAIRRRDYSGDCEGCSFQGQCAYCPGLSLAEAGDARRRSGYVCERTHVTMAAIDHAHRLLEQGAPLPPPDDAAGLAELFSRTTFAERQLAARRAGLAKQGHALRPRAPLVELREPRERVERG